MAHSSVTLAYPWGGFAPDSTLSIPSQITEDQAISLVGNGEARWPVGGAATSNAPQLYAWSANTVYATGQLVLDPVSGVMMSRNSTGTSGLSFDPTEAAFWTEVPVGVVLKASNGSDFADAGSTRANLRIPVLTPAQVVATSNQALTGQPTIDGYATTNGDVVLLTAQTTASQNGPWQLPASGAGAWARPKDFPSGAVVKGRSCKVVGGTVGAGTDWALMALTAITVDTTAQTWKMVGSGAFVPVVGQPPGLTLTDGQLLARSDAAGGLVGVNPTGSSQLAYAENNTSTLQTGLTNATVVATGCSITVPASSRPVYLSGSLLFVATVVSAATAVQVQVAEVSNGVDTPVTLSAFAPMSTAMVSLGFSVVVGPLRLAATTARDRTFNLQVVVPNNVTVTIENGGFSGRSWIAAEAR